MAPQHHHTIPFLVRRDLEAAQIELFTDSAGSESLGMGCVFGTEWAQGMWWDTTLFNHSEAPDIVILELLAIVTACEIWAPCLAGMTITLHSDNQTTVVWLTNQHSDKPAAMQLLRHVTKTCLLFQIYFKAFWVKGTLNKKSDLISRNQLGQLFCEFPNMDLTPQPLPSTLWPPEWTSEELQPKK